MQKNMKEYIKSILTDVQRKKMRNLIDNIKAFICGKNLCKLAEIYRTDKWGVHYYASHYQQHFKKFKYKKINLLEIGVGGYQEPKCGGESLRMWKKYFPFGNIFSVDLYDKSFLEEKRIKIFKGSQNDRHFLMETIKNIGKMDLIIDDGSHINEHVIETFKILFPFLNDGGIYVIEDTQTSYWRDYGGDSENLGNPKTIMNFLKSLTDGLNYREYMMPAYKSTYFDEKIISIHFYHNLVFIYKGNNNEESNILLNNIKED